ncbi:carboxypeptidase B-like [Lutzomyia longipalpis]|uniref:Peptidase M14 domain-containing protein n=2 Tax=Lutzomyia longipalpis TaxID=7200 RepID=A0A1B0GH59_LUTLO|nr:carboxypeptidase B-like [Lutzomyia longipalpis]
MRNFIVLAALFALSAATQVSYDGYQVVTIKVDDATKLDLLFQWQDHGIDFWDNMNALGRPVRVMIPPSLLDEFPAFLRENEISYELTIPNVETVFQEERRVQMQRRARALMNRGTSRSTTDFSYYWQTEEIHSYLRALAADYPNLVTLDQAGTSYEGREILVIRISNSGFDGSKPKIFIDATIHAREWIAPMAAMYLIHELVVHSNENADLLDCDWIIIPLANPDGYQFSHDSNRMWRKTRSVNPGSTCMGVDGNRNYRFNWGYAGISTNPCSDIYLGPEPHSEVEVQAVSNELTKEAAGVKLYLSFHSFGDWLLFPWGYDRIYHDNRDQLYDLGHLVADEIYYTHGRRYTVGNSAILLYPAAGASDDYAAAEHNIDLSYTVELTGGGSTGFDLPPDQIIPVSGEMFTGMRAYARYIAQNY